MCTPGGSPSACASDCTSWRLDRFATNPLLQAHGLPGDANNINGPSVLWAALAGIDYEFAAMAQLMAMRWGFNVHPQDLLPPLAGTPPTAWPQQVCALNDARRWECALRGY